jgi:GWxTD domain-containing protein
MQKSLSILFLLFTVSSFCQPLRDINYNYLYSPDASVYVHLKPVRNEGNYAVLYSLSVKDTTSLAANYSIVWEGRSSLSESEGDVVTLQDVEVTRTGSGFNGRGNIPLEGAPQYLVAKVTSASGRKTWLFYTPLRSNYPLNNYLLSRGAPVTQSFVHTNDTFALALHSDDCFVSYYNRTFPAAAPAFSEAQTRVSAVMKVDSVYRIRSDQQLNFPAKGLYLIQKDTIAVEGLAFRVEEDYPQYTKIASLAGPLIYITTRQEYDRLEQTNGNKRAFDRVILSITAETDRAKVLMRNYFRRVELANRFFTSYKEGWKTDRGMIYIIFGVPDEVFRFDDREVWNYDNDRFDIRFNFSRSSSLFDPDNYVLIRDKKYERTWYEVIDLWRNARF